MSLCNFCDFDECDRDSDGECVKLRLQHGWKKQETKTEPVMKPETTEHLEDVS